MANPFQAWQSAMEGMLVDTDDLASTSTISSDLDAEDLMNTRVSFGSSVDFWAREPVVASCMCGATNIVFCTCVRNTVASTFADDFAQQTPTQHRHSIHSESYFPISTEPQIREDSRPAVPTRKEVGQSILVTAGYI
jgi:hypothetical protein